MWPHRTSGQYVTARVKDDDGDGVMVTAVSMVYTHTGCQYIQNKSLGDVRAMQARKQ